MWLHRVYYYSVCACAGRDKATDFLSVVVVGAKITRSQDIDVGICNAPGNMLIIMGCRL